ncbi:MAG: hypothetical protein ACLFRG_23650 [Desulfococcaceae bacterium]
MITFKQYLTNKGIQQGIEQGENRVLCRLLARKFRISEGVVGAYLNRLNHASRMELSDRIWEWDSFDQAKDWLESNAES